MSQVDIRARALKQRNREVQRSEGWSFLQGASAATDMGQASGQQQEVRSGRHPGPLERTSAFTLSTSS